MTFDPPSKTQLEVVQHSILDHVDGSVIQAPYNNTDLMVGRDAFFIISDSNLILVFLH